MKTIRIHIGNKDTDEVAVKKVISVIRGGLVSKTKKYGDQYCFVTSFTDGTVVGCKKFYKGITFTVLDDSRFCLPNTTDMRHASSLDLPRQET